MPEKIDLKKIMASNPAVDEKEFRKVRAVLEDLRKSGCYRASTYNLLPPFSDKRRIRVLDETDAEKHVAYIRF